MLPQTTGDLYDLLEGDATLAAMLGTYTYRDGTELPALARLWQLEGLVDGPDCSGLEVSIARLNSVNGKPYFTGEVAQQATMRIYVTQWSVPPGGDWHLDAAVSRILALLEGAASSMPNTLPEGLTGLGQVVIRYEAPETDSQPAD